MGVQQINGLAADGITGNQVSAVDLGGGLKALVVSVGGSVTVAGKAILTACGSASSNTAIVAAVPAKRIKCVFVSLRTSYSAGAIVPVLTDGNGGTTIYQDLEQAISGSVSGSVASVSPPGWICGTAAGNALYLNPNGQTVYYTISYFADDAS